MSYAEDMGYEGLEDLTYEALRKEETENVDIIIHISKRAYPQHPIWITQEGKHLTIDEMSTQHIKNCLKEIYKRNGTWRREFIRPFECELRRRKYIQTL